MKKIRKWFEPSKNKLIATIISALLISVAAYSVYIVTRPQNPTVVFKENIVLEYGSVEDSGWASIIEDSNHKEGVNRPPCTYLLDIEKQIWVYSLDECFPETRDVHSPVYKLTDIVDIDNSKFDLIKRVDVDTSKVGEFTSKVCLELNSVEIEYEFDYEVKDTAAPTLIGVKDIETDFGVTPDYTELFEGNDPIDGKLEVTVVGDIDYNKAGEYVLTVITVDANDNKTEQEFTVTIAEEVIVPEIQNTTAYATNNEHSNINNSSNNSSGNKPNNNTAPTNPGSNNNAGTVVPPVPTPPVSPPVVVPPAEEENPPPPGMLLYKDYGTFQACSAVINSVSEEHIREWQSSICFDDGKLFYKPN